MIVYIQSHLICFFNQFIAYIDISFFNHTMNFALDSSTNKWCNAATCDKVGDYVCWCPEKHPVFVRKPSGKEGVRVVAAHFAHFRASEGQPDTVCRKGGESDEHMNAKMVLQTKAGLFSFVTTRCPECGKETVEDCSNGTVALEIRSDDRKWRYDAVYTDVRGMATALEVFHSHATTMEKIQSTRSNGMRIAEFSSDNILQLAENGGRIDNLAVETDALCSAACEFRVRERERIEEERRRGEIFRVEEAERIRKEEEFRLQETQRIAREIEEEQREEADRVRKEEEERALQIRQERMDAGKRQREAQRKISADAKTKRRAMLKTTTTAEKDRSYAQPITAPRQRKTYTLSSFGLYYPPTSRPFTLLCHHGVFRRRHCEHCAASDAEFEAENLQ
jgi:hypothetical protein